MGNGQSATVIKKYANRRLYHTGDSTYVTLDDLAEMTRRGEDFVVQDAKTGEDITRSVLGQIIFDAESRGAGLLPISFLRQLITFYGGHMQALVPTYLEHALSTFTREQEQLAKDMNRAFGEQAFSAVEDQVRRNMDIFSRSMAMFVPTPSKPERAAPEDGLADDVQQLRKEMAAMQERLQRLEPQEMPNSAAEDDDEHDDFMPRVTAKGAS